jgi:hypothetical protein
MKKTFASVLGMALSATAVRAAIIVTSSGTTPTTDVSDQFYLPVNVEEAATIGGSATNAASNDGFTYVANDRSSKGMSFTTGANVGGYSISSITIQNVIWPTLATGGSWSNVQNNDTFDFRFGTISGTSLSSLYSGTATYNGAAMVQNGTRGTGLYFTFSLAGEGIATLAANTTYFFEVASGTGDPFFELNNTAANGYVGGQAFAGNNNSVLDTDSTISLSNGDFAFHADLAAVPEPASMLLGAVGMISLLRRRRR